MHGVGSTGTDNVNWAYYDSDHLWQSASAGCFKRTGSSRRDGAVLTDWLIPLPQREPNSLPARMLTAATPWLRQQHSGLAECCCTGHQRGTVDVAAGAGWVTIV